MEINLLGTKGHYTVKDGAQLVPKRRIVASYAKIVVFAIGYQMICTTYWVLSSLATSFNAELGSFSLAALFFGWQAAMFFTPSLLNIVGAKTCAVGSACCAVIFSVSYFYPTWYTLMPSSLVMGLCFSLLYTASGTIKNDEVRECVESFKVDPVTYQGRFSGITVGFGLGVSSFLSGVITIVILSFNSASISASQDNCTELTFNDSSTGTLQPPSLVSPTVYYTLVATMVVNSLASLITFSIVRGATYHQCNVCSFGLKEALRSTATYVVKVFKQASTPEYGLVLPLRLNQGFMIAYLTGVFTRMYVTECVGVEFVGVLVTVQGLASALGSFGSGWLIRYTTSYMMVLVCIGGLEMGSLIFLIVWERQPSFGVIIAIPAIIGLCYGLNATVALAYSGTAPGDNKIGYSVLIIEHTGATAVEYFISEVISAEANLFVMLVITIVAVPLFTIADIHYGSGTSRNICGKKKVAVVDNTDIKSEPVNSMHSKEKGGHSKMRRESATPLVENSRDSKLSMNGNTSSSPNS